MNYYLEYIKYLSLKGGAIPIIDNDILIKKYLPLNYSDYTITFNNKEIKKGEETIYNLNSNFKYQKQISNDKKPSIVTNNYLFNNEEIKINEENKILFETLFLQNSFNIIPNLRKLLTCKYLKPMLINKIKEEDKELLKQINDIINKHNAKFTIFDENKYPSTKKYVYLREQMNDHNNFKKIILMKSSFDDNLNTINTFNSNNSNKSKKERQSKNTIQPNIELNNIICNMIKFKNIIVNNDATYTVEIEADNIIKSIKDTIKTYFHINVENDLYIGVSVNANILNKYIFINKFRELLEILYSDSKTEDEIETQILNLYDDKDAFVNISDMMSLYDKVIKSKDDPTNIKYDELCIEQSYDTYIKNEIKLIKELKKFIKYCNIIDNTDGLKDFIKNKTSLIFFASFIGAHFNKLSIGKITNSLYPINNDNLICNLLQIDNDTLEKKFNDLFLKEQEKLNIIETIKINKKNINNIEEQFDNLVFNDKTEDDLNNEIRILTNNIKNNEEELKEYINYDLFNNINLPNIFKFNTSSFEGNIFPDCVENALLHFVRAIIWDPTTKDYDSEFLPKTSIDGLKEFVNNFCKLYKEDPTNENNPDIKIEFNKLIQNKFIQYIPKNEIYSRSKNYFNYEIRSSNYNVITVLNYLFGITDCINYKYPNIYINKIINIINVSSIIDIEYKNILFNIRININHSHTIVSININNPEILLNYKFIDMIYLLSSDYDNHLISKFNIYDKYLLKYTYENDSIIPFYLILLLFNKNLYLIVTELQTINLYNIINTNIIKFKIIFEKIKIQYRNTSDDFIDFIIDLKLYTLLKMYTNYINVDKSIQLFYLTFLSQIDLKDYKIICNIDNILLKKLCDNNKIIDNNSDVSQLVTMNRYSIKVSFFEYYFLACYYNIDDFKFLLKYYVQNYEFDINNIIKKKTLHMYNNNNEITDFPLDIYLLYMVI